MEQQTKIETEQIKITKAAMESELGDNYKRCWAMAFKYANEGLGFSEQIDKLVQEFDLIKAQAEWFITGANKILLKNDQNKQPDLPKTDEQPKISSFAISKPKKTVIDYVSQTEMMSFLEDLEELTSIFPTL